MKKIGVVIGFGLALLSACYGAAVAQTIDDLVLYSLEDPSGSARAVGLGGAIGAVGGDVASSALNPAGIGLYRKVEFSASGSLGAHTVRTRFLDQKSMAQRLASGFDGAAAIFSVRVGGIEKSAGLMRINFGVTYNKLQNFSYRQSYGGEISDSNSLLAAVASEANGLKLVGDLLLRDKSGYMPYDGQPWFPVSAYGSYLMLDGAAKGTFKHPWTVAADGSIDDRLRQSGVVNARGSLGEIGVVMSFNVSDRFYIGATLGIQLFEREVSVRLREEAIAKNDDGLLWGEFNSYDARKGRGVNFKLGMLYNPISDLRVGFAIHTPTIMNVKSLFSLRADGRYRNPDPAFGEPNVGNPTDSSGMYRNDFSYMSPLRASASLAYTFGKHGLLSVDYEMAYLPLIQFSEATYSNDNGLIQKYVLPTHEVRVGTEWFMWPFAVRVGGGYRTSPYRSDEFSPLRWRLYFGGGFGFYGRIIFCDFAYRHFIQPGEGYMYQMGGYQRAYNARYYRGMGILTFGLRF